MSEQKPHHIVFQWDYYAHPETDKSATNVSSSSVINPPQPALPNVEETIARADPAQLQINLNENLQMYSAWEELAFNERPTVAPPPAPDTNNQYGNMGQMFEQQLSPFSHNPLNEDTASRGQWENLFDSDLNTRVIMPQSAEQNGGFQMPPGPDDCEVQDVSSDLTSQQEMEGFYYDYISEAVGTSDNFSPIMPLLLKISADKSAQLSAASHSQATAMHEEWKEEWETINALLDVESQKEKQQAQHIKPESLTQQDPQFSTAPDHPVGFPLPVKTSHSPTPVINKIPSPAPSRNQGKVEGQHRKFYAFPELTLGKIDLSEISAVTIRAYGCGAINSPTYFAINTKTLKILCVFEVDEVKEAVLVKDASSFPVLTSTGGLLNRSAKMIITHGSNLKLAEIDVETIIAPSLENPQIHVGLCELEDGSTEYELHIKGEYLPAVATFSCYENDVDITYDETEKTLDSLTKTLILLSALQMYHITYKLNLDPMPFGIFSRMQPGTQNCPSLKILDNLTDLRFRMAFRTDNCDSYMDVLRSSTWEIALVAVKTENKIVFKDAFGTTQFYATIKDFFVYSNRKDLIGHFHNATNQICLQNRGSQHAKAIMQFKHDDEDTLSLREDKLTRFSIVSMRKRKKNSQLARIYPDMYTVRVQMENIDWIHKALVLAHCAMLAIFYYAIDEQVTPKRAKYPFRATSP